MRQSKYKHTKKHPGFKAIQQKIARKYGMKSAGAILAAASRRSSTRAKRLNPRLKRVRMKKVHRKRKVNYDPKMRGKVFTLKNGLKLVHSGFSEPIGQIPPSELYTGRV